MTAALVAARWAHYLSLCSLFGLMIFPTYTRVPSVGRTGQAGLLALAVASGLAWLMLSAATMSGDAGAAIDPSMLGMIIRETPFGLLWVIRGAIALLLAHVLFLPSGRHSGIAAVLLTGALLVSLAGTGHAQSEEGAVRYLHVLADGVHLLAAAIWIGGLFGFVRLLRSSSAADTASALRRFAGVGSAVVAVLIATGFINSWLIVGSPDGLIRTVYGWVLLAKLMAFAAMIMLAGVNRIWLVPRMPDAGLVRLAVTLETGLGVAVLAAVAILGTLDPAA